LAVITKIIAEHHDIREHVKFAGDTVTDIEALFTLQKAYSGWTQSSAQALMAKQNQLQQAINFLEQGLKNHFASEEKALPPLFGELLMRALLVAHHDIGKQIENAKAMLAGTKLEGLSQPELLSKKSEIQHTVSSISQVVSEHASQEEIILNMIKRALEVAGQAHK
jgi:2-hydroxychromene-2-carboxylate isomerase